ncbi:hypothetical protein PoB_002527800 [Plakobranchus ocellatus]|uniref:Uncharacterized protein n=1 Tax=Plakobranchus ocellatus TaxID=259542 RepID=A0AAV3ZWG8_9GAST|nr:hypothetical protein PoB_002527800 [Plakobranchus ocellatus]
MISNDQQQSLWELVSCGHLFTGQLITPLVKKTSVTSPLLSLTLTLMWSKYNGGYSCDNQLNRSKHKTAKNESDVRCRSGYRGQETSSRVSHMLIEQSMEAAERTLNISYTD